MYVGGDLYVADDIVYDEVSGRNIAISGIGTITALNASTLNVSGFSTFTGFSTFQNSLSVNDQFTTKNANITGILTAPIGSLVGAAIGIQSGGTWISTGTTTLNLAASGSSAETDPVSGITTVNFVTGVSIGLAIALGG